ncbi:UNC-50 protein [Metschnikowia bicuspidata var. bicuspidata NRRL YB-4993]|uniref:UNC-50 protein n=1 Tax=Metschnikowia bicuspidata var. bicuspidata NRRL YB-4993 TaxID=869754 RepID=A0A1A0HH32_9ASCO|nr:UNC-50 protein [Metschnikowia bicuspidata var. bicuspidata NRRL YB-4993]OBA23305.1 UNC-50 protein [Metschnikowia bicuspidata var. bicuspidata NRRL YB-4993]
MTSRGSLPYTYQDLFPHTATSAREQATPALISAASFTDTLRSGNHHLTPARNLGPEASTWAHWRKLAKRLVRPKTLDFETATWEVFHLIVNPRKMYRSNYTYKHSGKQLYLRDDPSFLILVTGFLVVSAIAWGATYLPSVWDIVKLVVTMVVFDFYVSGAVIATIAWIVSNKLFNPSFSVFTAFLRASRLNINYIDWAFCFDIHCNSFLVIWCLLYLVQFFLLPILTIKDSFLSMLLGNTLYFGAVGHYFVVTFYGFNSLPFVSNSYYTRDASSTTTNPARILQMTILAGVIPVLAIAWLLSVLFHFNVAYTMVHNYFD